MKNISVRLRYRREFILRKQVILS